MLFQFPNPNTLGEGACVGPLYIESIVSGPSPGQRPCVGKHFWGCTQGLADLGQPPVGLCLDSAGASYLCGVLPSPPIPPAGQCPQGRRWDGPLTTSSIPHCDGPSCVLSKELPCPH